MKAVGAKHENIPHEYLVLAYLNISHQLATQRAAEHVAVLGFSRFVGGDESEA